MKTRIGLIGLVTLMCLTARATTVNFSTKAMIGGGQLNARLTISPAPGYALSVSGTNNMVGWTQTVPMTNGLASCWIEPGRYEVRIAGLNGYWTISVWDSPDPLTGAEVTVDLLAYYYPGQSATMTNAIGGTNNGVTSLASASAAGLMPTNLVVRTLNSALAHRAAMRTKIPMFIYPYAAGAPGATWQFIVGAAQYANTNGFVQHGYDTIVMQCGTVATNRNNLGDLQLEPTRFSIGVTNLVAMLATNGMKLGLQMQFSAMDNDTNCDCASYANGGPELMIGPTNAYRDGLTIGRWGMSHVWIGNPGNGTNETLLRYITDNFEAGLYDGAASIGSAMPTLDISFSAAWPHYKWLTETYNMVYSDLGLPGDPQTVDPRGLQLRYFDIIAQDGWLYTGDSVPTTYGFYPRNVDGRSWRTVDAMRFEFGMSCMESLPLAPNVAMPNSDESVVVTNDAAIAIGQDLLRSPAFVVSSNATSAVIGKRLMNGDVAVALWNLNTNAATAISINLLSIPGIWTNVVSVVNVFDGGQTTVTNALSATVNTDGLNLYRLLLTPTVAGLSGNYVGTSGGLSSNQVLLSATLNASSQVAASVVYAATCPVDLYVTNLVEWHKPDALNYTNGTATNWADSTSLHNDTTNVSNQPLFYSNVVNGLGAFLFTNSAYLVSKYFGGSLYTNFTLLVMYNQASAGTERIVDKGVTGSGWGLTAFGGIHTEMRANYANLDASQHAIGTWDIAGEWVNYPNMGVFDDGSTATSAIGIYTSGVWGDDAPWIGSTAGGGNYFTGWISEVMFWNTNLSPADLNYHSNYLYAKYKAPWPTLAIPINASPVASQAWVSNSTALLSVPNAFTAPQTFRDVTITGNFGVSNGNSTATLSNLVATGWATVHGYQTNLSDIYGTVFHGKADYAGSVSAGGITTNAGYGVFGTGAFSPAGSGGSTFTNGNVNGVVLTNIGGLSVGAGFTSTYTNEFRGTTLATNLTGTLNGNASTSSSSTNATYANIPNLTSSLMADVLGVDSTGHFTITGGANLVDWAQFGTNVLRGLGGGFTNGNVNGVVLTNIGGLQVGAQFASAYSNELHGTTLVTNLTVGGPQTNRSDIYIQGNGYFQNELTSAGFTNTALTPYRLKMTGIYNNEVSAAASGAVPINADGTATTSSQLNTVLTNLNGAIIQVGTVSSNSLDTLTKAQLALAGTSGNTNSGLNASQVASQISASNLVTSAQVGTQIGNSNLVTSAQVGVQIGSSNLITSAQAGAQIGSSNLVTSAKVGVQVGSSNYLTSASALTGANLTAGTVNSNSLDTLTMAQLALAGTGGSGVTNNQYLPGVPIANGSGFTNLTGATITGNLPLTTIDTSTGNYYYTITNGVTLAKTNALNTLYLVSNGITNSVVGVAWVEVRAIGTNYIWNY
jgi:alpha-galactosidase